MVAILAMQEEEEAPLGMDLITKVVTTALLLLLNMLVRNNSMEDNKSLLMVQDINPIKVNNSSLIIRTSMATMAHHKANRRDIIKATMLPTPIRTTLLAVVVEDQTTIMKINSVSSCSGGRCACVCKSHLCFLKSTSGFHMN